MPTSLVGFISQFRNTDLTFAAEDDSHDTRAERGQPHYFAWAASQPKATAA